MHTFCNDLFWRVHWRCLVFIEGISVAIVYYSLEVSSEPNKYKQVHCFAACRRRLMLLLGCKACDCLLNVRWHFHSRERRFGCGERPLHSLFNVWNAFVRRLEWWANSSQTITCMSRGDDMSTNRKQTENRWYNQNKMLVLRSRRILHYIMPVFMLSARRLE